MNTSTEGLTVNLAGDIIMSNMLFTAGLTLAFYDYLLTLRDEVRLIWRRRFSGVTVIFVIMRYGSLLYAVLVTAQIPSLLKDSGARCGIWNGFIAATHMSVYCGLSLFSCFRVYAITGGNRKLTSLVSILMIVFLCLQLYSNIAFTPTSDALTEEFGCHYVMNSLVLKYSDTFTYTTVTADIGMACAFAGEVAVQLSTWRTTLHTYRVLSKLSANYGLTSLLLRDGTIGFAFVLIWSTVSDFTQDGMWTLLTPVLFSVAICRFILRLRQVHLPADMTAPSAYGVNPSLIVGNLGASLRFSAGPERDDRSDDEEEPEDIILSNNPLETSLSISCEA